MSTDQIIRHLSEQLHHLKAHAFKSYDLCDITSQRYFLKINELATGSRLEKYIKYPHNLLVQHFSPQLRKLYDVEKRDFAQSNAFIVRGLVRLYNTTKDQSYLEEAKSLIGRITDQKSEGFNHACWGQPYDWFSGKIIPAYTPRTTVTSQVGKMFLELYELLKDERYLDEAKSIGDFFLNDMPLSHHQNDQTCFSYTTIDHHKVHNPNLMASGFLAQLSMHTSNQAYMERALTAAKFSFAHMNPDGSWYYAHLPNGKPSKIDNYHTGYNIEGALLLQKAMGTDFPFEQALDKAIRYYRENLFSNEGIPFLTNRKKFPIDIQCCAQSIITHSLLAKQDKNAAEQAFELFDWTTRNMYENGTYHYRIFKNGTTDKTAYVRWGDAWMFFAGTLLLAHV